MVTTRSHNPKDPTCRSIDLRQRNDCTIVLAESVALMAKESTQLLDGRRSVSDPLPVQQKQLTMV